MIDIDYYHSDNFVLSQFPKQNGIRHGERKINAKPRPIPEKTTKENSYVTLENFPELNKLAKESPALSNILEKFIARNGVGQAWNARIFQRALGTTFEGLTNVWISDLLPNEKSLIDSDSCMRVFKEIDGCPTPDGIIIDKGQLPIIRTFLERKTNYNRQEENFTQLANAYAFIQELRGQEIFFKNPTVLDRYGPNEQYHSVKIAPDAKIALVIPYQYSVGKVPSCVNVIESPFSRNTTIEVTHAALTDYQTLKATRPINKFRF